VLSPLLHWALGTSSETTEKPNDELLWDNYKYNGEWNEVSNENRGEISQQTEAELNCRHCWRKLSHPLLLHVQVLPLSSPNTISWMANWAVFKAVGLVFRWITELKSVRGFCSCLRWSKVAALPNRVVQYFQLQFKAVTGGGVGWVYGHMWQLSSFSAVGTCWLRSAHK